MITKSQPERPIATAGFTIIELLVCLTVMGVIVAVGAPRLFEMGGHRLRVAARTLSADLRLLRVQAIRQQHATGMLVNKEEYILLPQHQFRKFSKGIVLEMHPMLPDLFGTISTTIGFLPDGSSTGGTILLSQDGAVMRVTVSWSDGSVRING